MRKIALFYLRGVSASLSYNLYKVLNVHTLLLLQVLNTVPHPELLRLVSQVLVYYYFYLTLLLILSKPDILQPLVDVKAEELLLIVVLSLSRNEPSLRLLYLSRDLY
jgi:hypothetical protein